MYFLWLLIRVSALKYAAATKQARWPLRRDVVASELTYSNTTVRQPDAIRLESAESCAHDILAWIASSSSWSYHHTTLFYNDITSTQTLAGTVLVIPSFEATSMTTLDDGHPRVVGFAQSTSTTTTVGGPLRYTTSIGQYPSLAYNMPPYNVPVAPCTIAPNDCQSLYERNVSLVYGYNASKICSFTTTSYRPANGQVCQECVLVANYATLLYWPVRTVEGSASLRNGTVQTIGLSRTADGPNTFVTEGITITSPSVGIALSSLSRYDGCYTTVASTIVVVHPSEVLSIRSARAWAQHWPFAFQDLNYKCRSQNSSIEWIQNEPGDNCYQQVPADAYLTGESAFGWDEYYPTSIGPPLTIGPDYKPYILPPYTMTAWANSLFNETNCQIAIPGVWDPPSALLPGTAVDVPQVAWQTATSTSTRDAPSVVPAPSYTLEPGSTAGNPTPARQTSTTKSSAQHDSEPVIAATSSIVESLGPVVTPTSLNHPETVLTVISQDQAAYTIIRESRWVLLVADGNTARYAESATDGFAIGSVTLSASEVLNAMKQAVAEAASRSVHTSTAVSQQDSDTTDQASPSSSADSVSSLLASQASFVVSGSSSSEALSMGHPWPASGAGPRSTSVSAASQDATSSTALGSASSAVSTSSTPSIIASSGSHVREMSLMVRSITSFIIYLLYI